MFVVMSAILMPFMLSGCGIIVPELRYTSVDLREIEYNTDLTVLINNDSRVYTEAAKDLVEILYDAFASRFKNTRKVSELKSQSEFDLYIEVVSAFYDGIVSCSPWAEIGCPRGSNGRPLVSNPYLVRANASASVIIRFGPKNRDTLVATGYGGYSESLAEMLIGISAAIPTLGIGPKYQSMAYISLAKHYAIKEVSHKLFNAITYHPYFAQLLEDAKIAKSLPADLHLTVDFSDKEGLFPNKILDAAEEGELIVSIENKGKGTGYEAALEITGNASEIHFDKSISVGDVNAGGTKEVRVRIKAGLELKTDEVPLTFSLKEKRGYDARRVVYPLRTAGLVRPKLTIGEIQLNDGQSGLAKGNGNGIAEPGETVEATAFIRNDGEGRALGVVLRGTEIPYGITWLRQDVLIGAVPPGETVKAKLAFSVARGYSGADIECSIAATDVRGVGDAREKARFAFVKRAPDLVYSWRALDASGREVSKVSNGAEYLIEVKVANKGALAAHDTFIAITGDNSLNASPGNLALGTIPEANDAPAQSFRFSLGRRYDKDQAAFDLTIGQSDFPSVNAKISLPVVLRTPRLAFSARLHGKNGVNVIEQGERAYVDVRVINEGELPAHGVNLAVASRDDNLSILGKTSDILGTIEPFTSSETVRFEVGANRRIKPGTYPLQIEIIQSDFPSFKDSFVLAISEEKPLFVKGDTSGAESIRGRSPKPEESGPIIRVKGDVRESEEDFIRLAFEVEDRYSLVEEIRVTVNWVNFPLNPESGIGTKPSRKKEILANIPLKQGENNILLYARNSDYRSATKNIRVMTLGEGSLEYPPVTGISNPDAVAVVIGISRYENTDIPPVDYARSDAEAVRAYLMRTFGYFENRILTFLDSEARLDKLRSAVRTKIRNLMVPNKTDLFVYYSGHGVTELKPRSSEVPGNHPYIVPFGMDPSDIENTAYALSELFRDLENLPARSIVVAIDACFSGLSENGPVIKGQKPVMLNIKTTHFDLSKAVLFTATSAEQMAGWDHAKRHGLFTFYFLQGLAGRADPDGDGRITVRELKDYLQKKVPAAALKANRSQTPDVRGPEDFAVVRLK